MGGSTAQPPATPGAAPTTNGLPANSWFNNFTMFGGDQAQALRDWSAGQGNTPAAPTQEQSFGVLDSLYRAPAKIAATAPGATPAQPGVEQGLHDAYQSLDNYRLTDFANTLNQGGDPDAAYGQIQETNSAVAPLLKSMGEESQRQDYAYQDKQLNKNDNDFMHKLVGGIASGAAGAALGGLTGGGLLGQAGLGAGGQWAGLAGNIASGAMGRPGSSTGDYGPVSNPSPAMKAPSAGYLGPGSDWAGLAKKAMAKRAPRPHQYGSRGDMAAAFKKAGV